MSEKLILIIDPNESYLQKEMKRCYQEMKNDNNELKEVNEWLNGYGSEQSLFGLKPIYHLKLRTKDEIKKFTEYLKKYSKDKKWWNNGVIITLTTSVGAKKIKDNIKDNNGVILEKEDPETIKIKMLEKYNLSSSTKSLINYHVGNDYEMLLPLTNSLDKLTNREQKELTPEDALKLMLSKPGEIPPWEFSNTLFKGDLKETLSLYERNKANTHPLVSFTLLKNKIELLFQAGVIYNNGIRTYKGIANALKMEKTGGLYAVYPIVSKVNLDNLYKIGEITNNIESKLKGKSVEDGDLLMIQYITKLYYLFGFR